MPTAQRVQDVEICAGKLSFLFARDEQEVAKEVGLVRYDLAQAELAIHSGLAVCGQLLL